MNHDLIERKTGLMVTLIILVISLGGLVEILPLFSSESTTTPVAGESVYEHPFLWGSKRTGPDLARVGGRYSDDWQRAHLYNPRAVVPESTMPAFPWLFERTLDGEETAAKMKALATVGVPYTDADMAGAQKAVAGHSEADALVAYLQQLGTLLSRR